MPPLWARPIGQPWWSCYRSGCNERTLHLASRYLTGLGAAPSRHIHSGYPSSRSPHRLDWFGQSPPDERQAVPLNFIDLGLWAALLESVRQRARVVPTPVQARAIPATLSGRDVTQTAYASVGRTAEYALPLLQRLMGARRDTARAVRATVLSESRRVALHVVSDLRSYGAYLLLHCSASYDGRDMKPRPRTSLALCETPMFWTASNLFIVRNASSPGPVTR